MDPKNKFAAETVHQLQQSLDEVAPYQATELSKQQAIRALAPQIPLATRQTGLPRSERESGATAPESPAAYSTRSLGTAPHCRAIVQLQNRLRRELVLGVHCPPFCFHERSRWAGAPRRTTPRRPSSIRALCLRGHRNERAGSDEGASRRSASSTRRGGRGGAPLVSPGASRPYDARGPRFDTAFVALRTPAAGRAAPDAPRSVAPRVTGSRKRTAQRCDPSGQRLLLTPRH